MNLDLIPALAAFAFVSSITPGPNNLMLMASGTNFGLRRTVPHLLGVGIGFIGMIFLIGVALVQVFDAYPLALSVLKYACLIYLGYLAWKIANAAAPDTTKGIGTPITFIQAVLFQWVNPKAWAMGLTAVTTYAPDQSVWAVFVVCSIFGVINIPSITVWAITGTSIRRFLKNRTRLTIFNYTMAGLLILSVLPVLFE